MVLISTYETFDGILTRNNCSSSQPLPDRAPHRSITPQENIDARPKTHPRPEGGTRRFEVRQKEEVAASGQRAMKRLSLDRLLQERDLMLLLDSTNCYGSMRPPTLPTASPPQDFE